MTKNTGSKKLVSFLLLLALTASTGCKSVDGNDFAQTLEISLKEGFEKLTRELGGISNAPLEGESTDSQEKKTNSPLKTTLALSADQNKPSSIQSVEQNRTRLLASKACPGCNLHAVDLSRTDLTGANLIGADLTEANLALANLEDANLYGANLTGANIVGTNFRDADLSSADLRYAIMLYAILYGAKLDGTKFSGAKFTQSASRKKPRVEEQLLKTPERLRDKKQKTQPQQTSLSVNLETLKNSNECPGCSFKGANLQFANLEAAKLSDTNMQGANLRGAKLKNVDFQNADFWKTDLENADLRNANFKGARFMQVSLKGAKLAGANFEGADLRFVNLEGTQTDRANFEKAKLYATAITQPKTKLRKKDTNRLLDSKEAQKESTRTAEVPVQVAVKQSTQNQKSISGSHAKANTSKSVLGENGAELASLPLQKLRPDNQSRLKKKSRSLKNNIRPAEGAATAIHAIGSGDRILAGFRGGKLNLLQPSDGKIIARFKGHTGAIRAIAVDQNTQIAASGADDHFVMLWNLKTGKKIGTLNGHSKKVLSLSFTRDGRFLLSGSADKTVRVWNVSQKAPTMVYKAHKGEVGAIATLPGKPIAFSASASAKDGSVIRVWNYQNNVPVGTLSGHRGPVYALAVSRDGKTLVSGSKDKTLKIWNIKLRKPIKTLGVLDGHRSAVRSIVIADEGRLIASGSDDKTIIVWNSKSGEIINQIKKHKGKILGMTLSSDTKSLVSSAADKSVRVWKLVGNKYSAVN